MSKKIKFLAFTLCIVVVIGLLGVSACSAAAGKDGKSAYDIWLEQGNTGTEQDFLDSLKGDQGIQGPKGDQGDPGETPEITVGSNGNWYVDGKDTGVKAQGDQGDPGKDGPSWFSGAHCPKESQDIGRYVSTSKSGDFYICAECGYLWKSNGNGTWNEVCCLKGPKGDKGDPGESGGDPGFALNVSAGETAEMPIALSAGVYVVEVVLDQKIAVGRLEASVVSNTSPSVFTFSESRTIAAGNSTLSESVTSVYYSYVIVDEGDLKLTFAPTIDFKMVDLSTTAIKNAKVSITKWEQPTLEVGTPVEIPVESSAVENAADSPFKILLGSSITNGDYTITCVKDKFGPSDIMAIFNQSNTRLNYWGTGTSGSLTLSEVPEYFVFKYMQNLTAHRFIIPATVTLTKKV